MKEIIDYGKVFETLVQKTQDYLVRNGLHAQILGISGGIDSTVVAAICHEVSERTGIPLIGRSLPTKFNKESEITTAQLVGKAFCNDFEEVPIKNPYESFLSLLDRAECGMTAIANGNIQARLRMMYLYNLASIKGGLVMDTDNLTENNLGYFTIHGDVGDFNPIGGLWKTEVFKLAEYLHEYYSIESHYHENYPEQLKPNSNYSRCVAVAESLKLKPTAGLGITDSDLDEIGAESYDQVDSILQEILAWKWENKKSGIDFSSIKEEQDAFLQEQTLFCYPYEIVESVTKRHFASEFKRKHLPIVIPREEFTEFEILQNETYPCIKKHPDLDLWVLFIRPNTGFMIEANNVSGMSPLTSTFRESAFIKQ